MTMRQAYSHAAEYAHGLPIRLLFSSYKILPATNRQEMLASLSLRHEVYCREKQFERMNVAGIETDLFDGHSTQMVLSRGGKNIGCARFVHSEVEGAQHLLPIEKFGRDSLDKSVLESLKASGEKFAEISRLAILQDHRAGKNGSNGGLFSASAPLLTLMLGILSYSELTNTRYLMAFVERSLMRKMKRIGVPLIQIGNPIDHRGTRYPILIDRMQMNVTPELKLHYNRVKAEISQHLSEANTLKPTPKTAHLDLVPRIANDEPAPL